MTFAVQLVLLLSPYCLIRRGLLEREHPGDIGFGLLIAGANLWFWGLAYLAVSAVHAIWPIFPCSAYARSASAFSAVWLLLCVAAGVAGEYYSQDTPCCFGLLLLTMRLPKHLKRKGEAMPLPPNIDYV